MIVWQSDFGNGGHRVMKHEFYSRVRRYFRSNEFECWSVEFDYNGDGYISEDKIVLEWNNNEPRVLVITKSADRMTSEEYTGIILGLFEDLTDGEGTFYLKRIFDTNVDEYDIDDMKKLHIKFYEDK